MKHLNQVDNGVIQILPRRSAESFTGTNYQGLASATMLDFWQWAYSNIVGNIERGPLAEFIVARALNTNEKVRNDWEAYDLKTKTGIRVEVKSSAYLQSWNQQNKSPRPTFNIRKVKEWSPYTNRYSKESGRHSDVYVFCLLSFQGDKRDLNPLDLKQWEFYVVSTAQLNQELGDRKTITLARVQNLSCSYTVENLAEAVEKIKH